MSTAIFEARGISKLYKTGFALRELNMSIRAGDIYGFVGENGAGKTTLMKMIGGLVRPTSGDISLFGRQGAHDLRLARRKVGYLIELPALYPHMNAEENLTFYCRMFGIKGEKERIREVLESVGLSDVGRKKASAFSLGMRQRLGIAIALLNRPEFLVLDEPMNGLDPAGIIDMRKILEHLAKEQGVTILISSHILGELQLLATTYGFIHKGCLVQEISAADLLNSAQTLICISTPDPQAASEILRRELLLPEITLNSNGEIVIPKENTDLERLMSVLLKQGIPIEGFNLAAPNLEHYYMDLIGGGAR